ncbi:hypothetical protein LTR86_007723 [Recurvomyces mirabilis]|nr:hypothetical protein LTR86_007723 [Recurvomyces mirabilis]
MSIKESATMATDEGAPSKRVKLHYNDTIKVLAGSTEAPFTIHKDIVCAKSDFFAAACTGTWRESTDGVVRLPTVEADIVKLYVHWCYANDIEVDVLEAVQMPSDKLVGHRDSRRRSTTQALISLYVAANMLLDDHLKDCIMDEMIRLGSEKSFLFVSGSVQEVLDTLGTDSKIYIFIVDYIAARGLHRKSLAGGLVTFPPRFLAEVVVRMSEVSGKVKTNLEPGSGTVCRYHLCCKHG